MWQSFVDSDPRRSVELTGLFEKLCVLRGSRQMLSGICVHVFKGLCQKGAQMPVPSLNTAGTRKKLLLDMMRVSAAIIDFHTSAMSVSRRNVNGDVLKVISIFKAVAFRNCCDLAVFRFIICVLLFVPQEMIHQPFAVTTFSTLLGG